MEVDVRALTQEEAFPFSLQAILDALSDELIVVDLERRILLANRAAMERRGEGERLIGRSCHEAYRLEEPCDSPECECPIPLVLQTGGTVRVTHKVASPRGTRYLDVIASPLRGPDGRITHVVELLRDATEQRRAEEALVQRNEQLSTLNSLAATVNGSLDLDEVLTRALDEIVKLGKMDVAAIFLLQERLGDLQLRAVRGLSEETARLVARLGLLDGDCGGVINLGKMVVVPDVSRYGRGRSPVLRKERLRSLVHVPLNARGNILGSMCVGNRAEEGFSQEDLAFLSAVGDQIALAVENARLYAELQRKERVRGELLQKVITAQEEERKRVARELHDETSQALTALLYEVEEALEQGCDGPTREVLERMQRLARQTLEGIHKLIYDLRPSLLDHLGLPAALRWLAETRLEANGIRVQLEEDPALGRLPQEVEIALFRVVQEAISNILRHSGARNVAISLQKRDACLDLKVADDGVGFDMEEVIHGPDTSRGLGLLGMAERVQLLGGQFYISSTPGEGTYIQAQIPLGSAGAGSEGHGRDPGAPGG
ncbi:MAG: GAF domain-containing protein [Anaerolineae bacterium]